MLLCGVLTSCDPYFWMGMMAGMMSMPTTYNTYNAYPSYTSTYVPTYDYSGVSSTSSTSTSTSTQKEFLHTCSHCAGSGKCPVCYGRKIANRMGMTYACTTCNDKGDCPLCHGTGKYGKVY